MTMPTIATVVEGQGEVAAVPALLRRILADVLPDTWIDVPRPFRVGRDSLIKTGGIEAAVAAVAEQGGARTGVLVLLDADDDLPCVLGPQLLARAVAARADRPSSVVLAKREFEAWFLAAAPSLRGVRGLARDLEVPTDSEQPRDCKGWLTARRTDKRSYKPTADQAALAEVFNLAMARANSPSFDKLWRDVERLAKGIAPH
jgi:hypothetical protein